MVSVWGFVAGRLAPAPPPAPPRPRAVVERWARPLGFTVTVPPEMTGDLTSPVSPAPRVSRALALQVPAVRQARNLICGSLGTMPFCQLTVPGYADVYSALLEQPEADVARSVTMARTWADMLFEGRAWWRIVGFGPDGFPDQVVRLESESVTVMKDGRVWSNDRTGQAQGVSIGYQPDELLIRIDSPHGGLLEEGARAIRSALLLNDTADRYARDPMPTGYFSPKADVDLDPDFDVDETLDDWEDSRARRTWGYVGAGLEAKTLTWNAEQVQLMSQRDYAVLEIARIAGLDPEELGVSTTTRTYANAEQRRLDLVDFTDHPYVAAFEDRMSMPDVTQPGRRVYGSYDGFLRSDTESRMRVYDTGRKVGAYDDKRISDIERIPIARVRRAAEAAKPAPLPAAPPADPPTKEEQVSSTRAPSGVRFSAPADELKLTFEVPPEVIGFKADSVKRTISGLAVPWDVVARSGGFKWAFAPNSLHWSDAGRVKLDKDHGYGTEFGKAVTLTNVESGLWSAFKVARGASGDDALMLAEDGVYDGLSIYVTFEGEGDGYIPHPDDDTVRYVQSATLRKTALTAMPAFDDARVQHVAATRKESPMTAPAPPAAPPAAPVVAAPFDAAAFVESFTAGMTAALTEAHRQLVTDLVQAMPAPQRQVIPAGRLQGVKEPMVYRMNGQGPSFVRDAWKARTEGDHEARDRVMKFQAQVAEAAEQAMDDPSFAITTGNAGAVVPPGFRPELYVAQLLKGRPLSNAISSGTIADASPFTIPAFVSSSGSTADHVEGVNPSEGSLSVGTITVSPQAISGLYKITREIADSSNPAIDAIATQAMSESYSQQTEGKVYAKLNGANGVGGVITAGFVPSGAQAATTTGQGDELALGVRQAMALYPFRRFAGIDFGFLSQEATTEFATAVDTTGRPLLPWVAPMNPMGGASAQGYFIDGVTFQPAWSMTGNAAGDADVLMGNRNDVWKWESPVLNFRFEERSGPAFVELALFGYHAVEVLRAVGLSGIRHTHT